MKIIVYGQTEMAQAVAGALKHASHDVKSLTNKYFAPEPCDAAITVECGNSLDIVQQYTARGTRVYTLDTKDTVLPGYPVAVFEKFNVGDFTKWGFLNHATPDAYRNPEPEQIICSFYPAGPLVLEERPKPSMQRIHEVFHKESLAEAPRVWIVGGGPSLRGFDWDLLQGEVVIGANRAFEMPNVGMTITIDPLFDRLSHNGDLGHESRRLWRDYKGLKIYAATDNTPPLCDNVIMVPRVTNRVDDCMPPRFDNFGKASNSGYAAVKFAWMLGAKNIYCLGFDMAGENGLTSWFHDGYNQVWQDGIYDEYRAEMDAAAPFLETDGVNVTICGPSSLTAFPKITLAEAAATLSRKPSRPVVCGFYTRGTKYQQEAEAMARSAVAFGLDVSLVDVENIGDWKANTDQKPEAIRFALERMKGRPIAFVDADARFRAYPALFDAFAEGDSELGLSYFDWDAFPNDPRHNRELSSAVILLKPTRRVIALLARWTAAVKAGEPIWEQKILQRMVESPVGRKLSVMEIPMRYNQIFDHMSGLGLPVIEQMQASRRLKSEVAA